MRRKRKIPIDQRRRVLERDGRRCVMCWRPYQLHIHHFWNGTGLHTPYINTKDEDLVTLCASCHGKIETIWSRKSPFFKVVENYMNQLRETKVKEEA